MSKADAEEAEKLCEEIKNQIGYSLYYMICCLPDIDWARYDGIITGGQYSRVVEFGKNFAREVREPGKCDNVEWLREQLSIIEDEIENQC